jgi:zinc transporter ZupT
MNRAHAYFALPLAALVALVALLVWLKPFEILSPGAPPVEFLSFESVRLEPGIIRAKLRADGSGPVTIAQVHVDGAYRTFEQTPPGPLGRLSSAELVIPYPWVDGETHVIVALTSTGATFEHSIDVAQTTPDVFGPPAKLLLLVGLLLGLAPVSIGLMSYPALRQLGKDGTGFILAVTVGLLVYLLIDTLGEGLEAAESVLERFHASTLVWVVAIVTAAGLIAVGRRGSKPPEGITLATFIALGIGLHNLGEGLVVGAAFASGETALAAFLVIGFIIHNVTEGFGIAAPLTREQPSLMTFAGLALLAGLPALLGVFLGAQAVNPLWTAICFGIGAGAIAQVVFEISALIVRQNGAAKLARTPVLGGVITGLTVMYVTALLV